jgi:uncharacterized protein YxeA
MTIIKLAEFYDMSLEEFFKDDDYRAAKAIDKAVKWSVIVKRGLLVGLLTVMAGFGFLSAGRYYHVDWIDRVNPFLQTQLSYAIAPEKTPTDKEGMPKQVRVWATRGPFGDAYHSQWVTISVGGIPEAGQNYVVMERKGSYVSEARLIKRDAIPKLTATNIASTYMEKDDGEPFERHWNPFY